MSNNVIETPIIDQNLSSYEKFFDHDWCRRTFEAVESTPLADATGTLILAWRSTNGAHTLPWLMVECLRSFALGEVNGVLRCRADYTGNIVSRLTTKLVDRMQSRLNLEQRLALKRVVAGIEGEAHQATKTSREAIQAEMSGYWDYLVHSSEFQFCILGIQRINYGSLFFAYEDFLANVIRTKEPTYSSRKTPIKEALARHFGDSLADICWNHDDVDIARLVRNSLAHNGGRVGKDLEKYGSRLVDANSLDRPLLRGDHFNVVDGKLQITPDNTTYLFNTLKDRVTKIIGETA